MSRYIDADALKESFRKQTVNVQGKIKDDADAIIEAICKDIDLAPTVDAVPVVRCSQCKYGSKCLMDMIQCKVYGVLHGADWFCADGAYGERRNDGK